MREALDELLRRLLAQAAEAAEAAAEAAEAAGGVAPEGGACKPLPPLPPPLPPPPPPDRDSVDWRRVEPLVGLNDVLAALPAAAPWLVGVLTHHSGIVNFSLPSVSLPLGPLLGHGPAPRPLLLGVHVHRLSVGGLETVRRLELLTPLAAEPTGLESAAALGRLSLAADVEFRLVAGEESSLRGWPLSTEEGWPWLALAAGARSGARSGAEAEGEGEGEGAGEGGRLRVSLRASLYNLTADGAARLLANGTGLSRVQLSQALSGRGSTCLAQQLLHASLTSLGAALTLDSLDVSAPGQRGRPAGWSTPLRASLGGAFAERDPRRGIASGVRALLTATNALS